MSRAPPCGASRLFLSSRRSRLPQPPGARERHAAAANLSAPRLRPCPCCPRPPRAPDDAAVARELRAARAELKKERAASAKMFKGAFGAPPPPRPADDGPAVGSGAGDGGAARSAFTAQGLVAAALAGVWALLAWLLAVVRRLGGGRGGPA